MFVETLQFSAIRPKRYLHDNLCTSIFLWLSQN